MEQAIREKVHAFMAHISPLPVDAKLLVGFSGGADSTALVLLLSELEISFTAVHLNHGIRGHEAMEDETWCHRFCRLRHLPFESHSLDVLTNKAAGESMEMAARRLRLAHWKSV
ncbi:hypothetical protein BVY04_00060, partial [bacterium M21]